ncbi:monofunctional biosynthetic peptidoglycan transglycosylase [Brevundimonas lenta]|uniref:Biosynthetic peptidoglycan transglycosylase n=1 Tax=Brevundimonas lenta TaxID=424796 RepID=A0A7W6JCZ7_9CAUL|nr:monofunctional biosynthetic peptidoglycan transglycosylase [Brevundimonas lenta]MBB4081886.1 monofunctional biosynthetic peptidoglycan transglycosylase [Brevundimonas lenta]
MSGGATIKKRGRPLLTVFLALVLLVMSGVAAYAIFPPPITFLMASRALAGEGLSYKWRSLDDMSPRLVEAAIAAEDSTFCRHAGFDMKAIERALEANARNEKRGNGRVRGGSTISQQTAKNVFLWPGRDWIRKGLEAGYTVLIETVWSKRRIMEVYLNVAEMGPGVYGVEAASRHWFGKSADELTPREAARLIAILPSPRRYKAGSPGPYVRRRASRIQAAMGTVRNEGLATCVLG